MKKQIPSVLIVLGVSLGLAGFALSTRNEAGGLRNSANPIYWANRSAGVDSRLFNIDERIWYRGVEERNEVCLTFDDGPHDGSGAQLLDILREQNVPAAFFVVGLQVEKHPELVRRMIDEGHEVANHSYSHRRLDHLQETEIEKEFAMCDTAIERACGRATVFMRPPGMRYNEKVLEAIRRRKYIMVHWTIGAKDFIGTVPDYELSPDLKDQPKVTPELIVERVVKQLKPGGIILLHDNPVTVKALPRLIEAVRQAGFEFRLPSTMLKELPHQMSVIANPPTLAMK